MMARKPKGKPFPFGLYLFYKQGGKERLMNLFWRMHSILGYPGLVLLRQWLDHNVAEIYPTFRIVPLQSKSTA